MAFQRKWYPLLDEFFSEVEEAHSKINNDNYKEMCKRRQEFILTKHSDLVDFLAASGNVYTLNGMIDIYVRKNNPGIYEGLRQDLPSGWQLKEQLKKIILAAAVGRKTEEEIRVRVRELIVERYTKKEENVPAG